MNKIYFELFYPFSNATETITLFHVRMFLPVPLKSLKTLNLVE